MESIKKPLDCHIHPATREYVELSLAPFREALKSYFRLSLESLSVEEMVEDLEAQGVRGILLGWDAETKTGAEPLSNDWVSQVVQRFPKVFVAGFAGVDPHKRGAFEEMQRAIFELGLKGFKFHPSAQEFYPNDRAFYPLFAFCCEQKVPVLFHTGMTGLGAGMPGGGRIRHKYARPIPHLDDLAADFPELTIIAAHPSWPFQEEMLAVCLHKPNVFMDLSGWSPKYFPESLKREIAGRLNEKALFGSDYPFIRPKRWLKDFELLPLSEGQRENILFRNAERVLKIS